MFPCADMTTSTVISCLCQLFVLFGMPAYIHSDRGSSFMSRELREFLTSKGIATSRTTSYNPQGNGQTERYNGIIWKAITMALKSRELPTKCWQIVLPDALHSIRSLLSTATNVTPHERLFNFARRSSTGGSLPTWLCMPGPVLLKRHVRHSKAEPLVDQVELLQANPQFAYVRYPDGRETTVSIRHLAPAGESTEGERLDRPDNVPASVDEPRLTPIEVPASVDEPRLAPIEVPAEHSDGGYQLRRSERVRRTPVRLDL